MKKFLITGIDSGLGKYLLSNLPNSDGLNRTNYNSIRNNDYDCIGSYPIPGRSQVNFSKIARGAGFEKVYEFQTIDDFTSALSDVMSADCPVFVTLHVEIEKRTGKKEDNLDDMLAVHSKKFINKMNEITNNETRSQ